MVYFGLDVGFGVGAGEDLVEDCADADGGYVGAWSLEYPPENSRSNIKG